MGEIFVRCGRFPSEVLRTGPYEQALCLMAMQRTLEAEDAALTSVRRTQQGRGALPSGPRR